LADRQSQSAPAVQSLVDRVTSLFSAIVASVTTPKKPAGIDVSNPFIPPSSPVCRAADAALVYWVALLGFTAAAIALARQVL
jgi:hypothetical protein